MALQLRAKRPVITTKLTGALVAIAALLLQPFGAIPLPVASAASLTVSPASHSTGGLETDTSTANATGYQSLTLSFSYVKDKLELEDSLRYGWRTVGGLNQPLGQLDGVTSDNETTGAGTVSNVSLPTTADNQAIELYFVNTGSGGANDIVTLTNITIAADTTPITEQNAVCATGCEWTTIGDAVAGEAAGSTITVKSGTYPINSTVLVNKQLTITGQPGATITTSVGSHVFVTTAAGVVINGLDFQKTNKTSQNLINVQGANTTISNNTFTGQYVLGEGEVVRALEVSTTTGLNITGNTITAMRQPAYINDGTTGSITDNSVDGTRGWVALANTNLSWSGNAFGTNAVDMAFLKPADGSNNYSCETLAAIKANNDNAVIDNQALANPCPGPSTIQTVRGNDVNGWLFVQEESGNTDVTGGSFVGGPSIAPMNSGSVQFKLKSSTDRLALRKFNTEFASTPLKNFAGMSYSTYTDAGYTGTVQSAALQFDIDKDSTNGSSDYGRIVYEPYHGNDVRKGEWQAWNTFNGTGWWVTGASVTVCTQSSTCTWAQLKAAYPNAQTTSYAGPIIRTGNYPGNYQGNVDKLTIASAASSVTYDFEPEQQLAAPANLTPVDGSYTKDPSFKMTWDAVPGAVKYEYETTYDNGTKEYKDDSASSNYQIVDGKVIRSNNGAPQATYEWRVRALSASGLASEWSPRQSVTVDTTAPGSTNDLGSVIRGTVTIEQTVTDTNKAASGKLRVWKLNESGAQDNAKFYASANVVPTDANGVATYSLNTLSNLYGDGAYVAKFTSRDAAGNESVQEKRFTVDNTNPTITVKNDFAGNKDSKLFSKVSFQLYDKYNVDKFTVNNTNFDRTNAMWSDANFQNIKSAFVQGLNTITVYDVAGNSSSYEFTYDSSSPTAPVLTATNISGEELSSGQATNDYTIVANWNKPTSDTIKYMYKYWNNIDGNPYTVANPYTVETSDVSRSGEFNQGEGRHYLQVVAVDLAGNQSLGSNVFEVNYDITAPTVDAGDNQAEVEGLNAVLNGSAAGAEIMDWEKTSGPGEATFTPIPNGSSVGAQVTQPGTYVFTLKANDAAGNVGVDEITVTFSATEEEVPTDGEPDGPGTTGGDNTPNNTPAVASANPFIGSLQNLAQPSNLASAFIAAVNNGVAPATEAPAEETGDVLGTSTTEARETAAVAGVSDKAGWSIGDVAWYWWVAGVAGLTGLWLLIAAASRRLRGSEG
ncbi:MAG: hypothetical protein V4678_02910 [Patescibacteria group bacterium]